VKKTLFALVPVALIVTIGIAPASGQDAPPATPEEVVRELAGIRASLDELVTLLSTMRRNQDADLILRRIEMHERRLAPLERRLDANKRDQLNTEQSIGDIQNWVRQAEERILDVEREGREEVPLEMRHEVDRGQTELERLAEKLETLRRQQIEIENSMFAGRDDVEILDDLLEDLLD
jgi:chromosome segregation ATPase